MSDRSSGMYFSTTIEINISFMSKSEKNQVGSGNGKKNVDKIPQKPRKKGKTTKELMERHLKNKNDVITEDEFKNLNLETDVDAQTAHEPLEIKPDQDRPHDKDKDHTIKTPWDVIK